MQSREGLVSRRPGDDSGFVGWKWIELLAQTSELLCSSSLQGRANKTRGKVPVTSCSLAEGCVEEGNVSRGNTGKGWKSNCTQPEEMRRGV